MPNPQPLRRLKDGKKAQEARYIFAAAHAIVRETGQWACSDIYHNSDFTEKVEPTVLIDEERRFDPNGWGVDLGVYLMEQIAPILGEESKNISNNIWDALVLLYINQIMQVQEDGSRWMQKRIENFIVSDVHNRENIHFMRSAFDTAVICKRAFGDKMLEKAGFILYGPMTLWPEEREQITSRREIKRAPQIIEFFNGLYFDPSTKEIRVLKGTDPSTGKKFKKLKGRHDSPRSIQRTAKLLMHQLSESWDWTEAPCEQMWALLPEQEYAPLFATMSKTTQANIVAWRKRIAESLLGKKIGVGT